MMKCISLPTMKLSWATVGLATLFISSSAYAIGAQNPVPSALQATKKIVCLGDSITQGGENPGGYVWLVRHYLNDLYPQQGIEVINAGISGHKSTDMIARYQRDVLDQKPDLVTISVGVNDVWHGFFDHPKGDGPRGVPVEAYKANVDEMIRKAQSSGIRVVILSTTVIGEDAKDPRNVKAEKYNAALRELVKQYHLTYVDYQKPFHTIINDYRATTGGRENFLTVDGVHMNAEGNKVMAHTLLTALGISADVQSTVDDKVRAEEKG